MNLSKEELMALIDQKEQERSQAEREARAWNRGHSKGSHLAIMSQLFVEACDKELGRLYEQLKNYESQIKS